MNPYLDDPEGDIQGMQDIRKPKVAFDFMQPYQSSRSANMMMSGPGAQDSQDPQAMDSEAYQRYKQLLLQPAPSEAIIQSMQASRPNREDYKPNTITKILAAMAGFSTGTKNPGAGISTARKLLDQPYESALSDYNQDNQGKLEAARMQDSAFNRKLTSSQFDLNEERQRRAGIASQKDKETQRQLKQNEDIQKIDENLQKHADDQEKLGLERVRTNAQADADTARAGESRQKTEYYKSRGTIDPNAPEKPVDIGRDLRNDSAIKKQAEDDTAEELTSDPAYSKYFKTDKDGNVSLSDEVKADPKLTSYVTTIRNQRVKAKMDESNRRFRRKHQ